MSAPPLAAEAASLIEQETLAMGSSFIQGVSKRPEIRGQRSERARCHVSGVGCQQNSKGEDAGTRGGGERGRDLRQETPDIGCQGTAEGREEPEIGGASEGPDR
jgi:hypothetical protein